MSGPYGPNETPGPGEGRSNDPTQQWTGQPTPAPQQWGQPGGQQPWGQSQPQWGQQPQQPWGQPQQQPQWGQQSQPSWPQQQPSQPWDSTQQQWTQQQPPQQQWGQQPQQPPQDQWGQLQTKTKKPKRGLLLAAAGAAVVIVVGVVLAFVFLGGDTLDNKAVQSGVQKVLKDSYGIDDVSDVNCPSGKEVKVGNSFGCTLKVGGEQKSVTVKVTKDDGTYEVGRPS
ncbi:DUF4333 domain-containing protein [Nocardia terpenica]|uniref:DUF4333 domain-containing protein n=1 Tax=Nocardia terpenica TaxID=455432 RepID=A0A6G9Z2Y8_9NOCA|nr:DUF4333 domain-containing protein [Nocardia terpenica]QIS19878.1 DUF4333 domain-containing protein [Nocardia terpenica]